MKRTVVLTLLTLLHVLMLTAQTGVQLPQIIPPSPEAAALAQYGEHPVNLSNGLPSIEIPVYTIKSRKLQLPINLSYHASGIKVDEIASWVGLGWALQAGGVLTRTVRGREDEYGGGRNPGFLTRSQVNQQTDGIRVKGYLDDKSSSNNDNESDVYAYNVNGLSGRFMYSIDNEMIQQPLTDNKITGNPGIGYRVISGDGVIYLFDVIEFTSNNNSGQVPTAFYISKMISADKTDTIYFDYDNANQYYSEVYQSSNITVGTVTKFNNPIFSVTGINNVKLLRKIRFSEGYIDFVAAGDRKDRRKHRLSQINIYTNNGILKQSVRLNQDYFVSSTPHTPSTTNYSDNIAYRLRLSSVDELDNQGKLIGKYGFSYNTTEILPSYWGGGASANNPSPGLYYGQDAFGYYNGVTSNTHFQSFAPGSWSSFNVANRSVSPVHAQAAILKEITYPTGGKSVFTYESNMAYAPVGGLRIKKIEIYSDNQATPMIKTYTYSPGVSANSSFHMAWFEKYTYSISEYFNSTNENKTIYTCNPTFPASFSNNEVFYLEATETQTTSTGKNLGKTVYLYDNESDSIYYTDLSVPWYITYKRFDYYNADMSWARGVVKEINIYGVNPDGSFTEKPVRQTKNIYQKLAQKTYTVGINVFKHDVGEDLIGGTAAIQRSKYQYFDISANTGGKKLLQTIVTDYSPSGSLTQSVTYQYDAAGRSTNPHWGVTKSESQNSQGEIIQTINQYPADFETNPIYAAMLTENIKSPVVKQLQKINGVDSKGILTTYGAYSGTGGTMYLPSVMQQYYKGDGFQDALIFDAYNERGGVEQLHKPDDIKTVYLWNYNKTYPIAEIVNAAVSQVACTSFEADGTGNWTIGSTARNTTDALTGRQCYELSNGSLVKTGLDPAKTYVCSYWTKATSSVAVTGTQTTTQGPTHNGWIYWQKTVTGVNAVTITGSGLIDELRCYPREAQVVTYTYEPLVGMTSQCDINSRATYYEYDNYNRLKLIRDQDRSIIRTMDYNYSTGN